MDSTVTGEQCGEHYITDADGRVIKCESLADAIALKMAEPAATTATLAPSERLTPAQLTRVARKYGFDAMADAIESLQ